MDLRFLGTSVVGIFLIACGASTTTSGGGDRDGGSDGGSQEIHAADFEQSCTADSDCVPVYEGDVCAVCKCNDAAIASSAAQSYDDKTTRLLAACGPRPAIGCNADCPESVATCVSNKCTFGARQ